MTRAQATAAARYPDAKELELMEALARHHRVRPEQVVLGCGSGEVIKMADAAFLAQGQTVVVAEPTFEAVLGYAQLSRAEAVKVPLTADHRHDLRKMAEACSPRTGLVYVCNPNNPTGTIVSGAELQAFLHKVPAETVVLVDEAYHHFVEDPSLPHAPSSCCRCTRTWWSCGPSRRSTASPACASATRSRPRRRPRRCGRRASGATPTRACSRPRSNAWPSPSTSRRSASP